MALAIALLFVGLFLGFLVGARAKVLTALRQLGKAVRSFVLKIVQEASSSSSSSSKDSANSASSGGEDDSKLEEELRGEIDLSDVAGFLNMAEEPGLDDHPDLYMSPIVLYQIKKHKEEQLQQQRKNFLAAEGHTEEEIEEMMAAGVKAGGEATAARANPLALLISVGARVEAVRKKDNSDALARVERRRMQKTIDVFLNKTRDIAVKREDQKLRTERGARIKTANEAAKEILKDDEDAGKAFRLNRNVAAAKMAREQYRYWKATAKPTYVYNEENDEGSDGDEPTFTKSKKKDAGGGGGGLWGKVRGGIDVSALARLQAEYLDEFGDSPRPDIDDTDLEA